MYIYQWPLLVPKEEIGADVADVKFRNSVSGTPQH